MTELHRADKPVCLDTAGHVTHCSVFNPVQKPTSLLWWQSYSLHDIQEQSSKWYTEE